MNIRNIDSNDQRNLMSLCVKSNKVKLNLKMKSVKQGMEYGKESRK